MEIKHFISKYKESSAVRKLRTAPVKVRMSEAGLVLLLPRALLMAIGTQLLAPFMFVDFAFATFL